MVENKETRSQSPKQPLRHSYTLADGQRIPVLFRMKNIQSAAVASARTGASTKSQKAPAEPASKQVETVATSVAARPPEPTIAGPSWLRRNAYRFTVAVLLIATFLILNNNNQSQKHVASTTGTDVSALEAPVVEMTKIQSVPATNVATTIVTEKSVVEEAPKAEVKAEVEAQVMAPPALVSSEPANTVEGPTVETTESDSSTQYVISKPAINGSKNELPMMPSAVSTDSGIVGTVMPQAQATLLAPQTLGNLTPAESQFTGNQQSTIGPSLAVQGSTLSEGIPATTVSSNESKPTEFHTASATTQPNRYATAPGNGNWQSAGNGLQSTNEPNLDPSVLFAIKQNYQVQSSEQTVRDMKQQVQAQAQVPTATPSASQWQAIPTSNALPANAFAPKNNIANPNAVQQSESALNVPPQGTPQNIPKRPAYTPLESSFAMPSDPSLYSVATTPDGNAIGAQPKRQPYVPLSNQQIPQPGANFGSQYGTSNQLYETADQSFMGN